MNTRFAILIPTAVAIVLALAFAGVAEAKDPPRKYYWSDYEMAMYRAYSNPDDEDLQMKLAATMLRIIEESDKAGRKPPPGIVAEYGFFLYQRGELYAAIDQFRREATLWPESKTLMDRMIQKARTEAEQ